MGSIWQILETPAFFLNWWRSNIALKNIGVTILVKECLKFYTIVVMQATEFVVRKISHVALFYDEMTLIDNQSWLSIYVYII
jgi:hypothetical protein